MLSILIPGYILTVMGRVHSLYRRHLGPSSHGLLCNSFEDLLKYLGRGESQTPLGL